MSQALERRLISCSMWALVAHSMWNLFRPEIETVSPALKGRFLSTVTPGKSKLLLLYDAVINGIIFIICFSD